MTIKRNLDMSIGVAMGIARNPEEYTRENVEAALIILSKTIERAMASFERIRKEIPEEGNYI